MPSSRMCTTCSISRRGGWLPQCMLGYTHTPLGMGLEIRPGVGLETPPPGVGLETSSGADTTLTGADTDPETDISPPVDRQTHVKT